MKTKGREGRNVLGRREERNTDTHTCFCLQSHQMVSRKKKKREKERDNNKSH